MLTRRLRQAAKAVQLLRQPLWRGALRHGVGAAIEHLPVLRQCAPVAVLDIGAHQGQFALAARAVWPAAQIHSFEPQSSPAAKYLQVLGDDAQTTLHPYAIAPTSGKAEIHVSARNDSSSLLPIAKLQNELFPGTAEVATQTIAMRPLEKVLAVKDLPQPLFIKIDVQGYEAQVLQGLGSALKKAKWLYIEMSFQELYEGQALVSEILPGLFAQGFTLQGVYNISYGPDGAAVQADFLFTSFN
jgi:FkbM family methyltransferase